MTRIPIWMDCDTGTDDAVAIMLAHALPELDLKGISAVCGNTTQRNAFLNTHRVCGMMGARYPVYPGAEKPLINPLHTADDVHGAGGLGGVELPLPEGVEYLTTPAWDALYACAKAMPGALRLVATGPLTNVATAFIKYPDLPGLLHSVLFMGGASWEGNVTPSAEFNFYADPHAAELVLKCGAKLVMCGLDVTLQTYLTRRQLDAMGDSGARVGAFVRACGIHAWKVFNSLDMKGFCMHDSCPVMYAAHPELFEGEMAGVAVETRGSITNGKSVTDLYSDKQFPFKNALVLLKVDRERFMEILTESILKLG